MVCASGLNGILYTYIIQVYSFVFSLTSPYFFLQAMYLLFQ